MKKLTFLALLLLTGQAFALERKTIESECIYTIYEGIDSDAETQSVDFTTHQVQGMLLSWQIEAIQGAATFNIAHTTAAYPVKVGESVFTPVVVSSNITVNAGKSMSDDVRGIMKNPRIRLLDLVGAATAYIRMVYCKPYEINQ